MRRDRCRDCGSEKWALVIHNDLWRFCPVCDGAALDIVRSSRGIA